MTALPPISAMTGSTVTEGEFKSALTDLRAYLAGLLGDTGMTVDAIAVLGTLLSRTLVKTAAYAATEADRGALILGSGSWTLALPAAATAGAGYCLGLANTGSGTVTVDPAGAQLIDGAATSVVPAGQAGILVSTGSAWISLGFAGPVSGRVLAASGTAAAPGLTFGADPNSGFWRAGEDDIRLALGGVDAGLYRRGTVLGTVSQAAGVPTGALIEGGSNANGTYAKWADGTMLCRGAGITASASGEVTWTFPAAFATANVAVGALPVGATEQAISPRIKARSATAVEISAFNTSNARVAVALDMLAMGRWY